MKKIIISKCRNPRHKNKKKTFIFFTVILFYVYNYINKYSFYSTVQSNPIAPVT